MTTVETDPHADGREARGRPHLARGVELLGPYEHSGYLEPPLMVRRSDNQLVQLPPVLFLVAERLDGHHDAPRIAEDVSDHVGRELAPDDVTYLVEEKLAPLGIVSLPDGAEPELPKADQLLALRLRTRVVPEGVVEGLARVFSPLFWPPVLIVAIAGFIAFDIWLFTVHGVAGGAYEALHRPGLLLMTFGLVIVAAVFHEIGHAAACRYGGARPGVMGVGLYIVWPAFYTDVTDAYRLGRGGRLRTDLGGVYFNALFVLGLGGLYAATGLETLLLGAVLVHFEMAHQMLPFLRLDGYYVVADLVGVPDLFQRIKPILSSFVPGRDPDPRVDQLKPWVRYVVTGWVLLVVPIIGLQMVTVALVAPRIFGTALESTASIWSAMLSAFSSGRWFAGATDIAQLLLLVLPLAGIVYMFVMLLVRFVRGWRQMEGRPMARTMLEASGFAVVGLLAFAWWSDPARYHPLRSDERWVLSAWTGPGAGGPAHPGTHTPKLPASSETGGSSVSPPGPSPSPSVSPGTSVSPAPSGSASASRSPSPSPSPSRTPSPSPSTSTSPSTTPGPSASTTASPSPDD